MPRPAGSRFLAAMLLIDLVGSTAVASGLGDRRWRALLTRFRRVVRGELRRHQGREMETTGDGFIATFARPAQAIRAAAAIAAGAQQLGLEVRSGIHVGECEEIEGSVGGVAVHIGARVMALAGPAEVLTTQTVRDLVTGSEIGFEERDSVTLKGVDGRWQILAVRAADGVPLPAPLTAEEAEARRHAALTGRQLSRRRMLLLALGTAVVLAGAAVAGLLVASGGAPSRPHAALGAPTPPTLVRVDMSTGKVAAVLDSVVHGSRQAELQMFDGTLWQLTGNAVDKWVVARNVASGAIEHTLHVPNDSRSVDFGFGSIWVLATPMIQNGPNAGLTGTKVDRLDDVSGRRLATIDIGGNGTQGTIAVGNGNVWVLETDGTLVRIDPLTSRVTGRFRTGAIETTTLIPLDGYDWICECLYDKVLRFDPRTNRTKTFSIAQSASLIGVDSTDRQTLWLLDSQGDTLTPMNARSGATGEPLGLIGDPAAAVIADGAIWTAAGHVVDRIDLMLKTRTTIAMPPGFDATAVAADEATHSLWVGATTP